LYQSSRGGGLTFHWPGQLVVYPVLKLAKSEQSLPKFMHRLEEVGLRTLSELGIAAYRRRHEAAQIGLWHEGRKIASMGIFVARWITSFGFALNLSGDTRPARYIRPCGLKGVQLITIEEINGQSPDRKQVKKLVLRHFQEVFERKLISA
jgi:lipoyl(octanoyl) transferase